MARMTEKLIGGISIAGSLAAIAVAAIIGIPYVKEMIANAQTGIAGATGLAQSRVRESALKYRATF